MILFAAIIRTGLFAEGHFLGKVLDEWVVDAQEFLHTKLPHLLTIAIIALILSRIIALATRRMVTLAERKPSTPGHRSQVKTMAGVLRTTLKAVLWTLTVLQMLTVLGVNLGPLLASAGVAGIAIGLAAQTIVKDILNGTLILLEDQFNVGDTVRLTGMTGTVEAMSLRRTEIRDGDGTLYVVPNSQITTIANLSRDYTLATVNVSVDISASPDRVIALLKSIAAEVQADPLFSGLILADPQVPGVDAIKGSEVIYPVLFRTLPTRQYPAIREFRRRVRLALEAKGMIPGDPYRTFHGFTEQDPTSLATQASPTSQANRGIQAQTAAHPPTIDPTTIKSAEHNPFSGE